MSKVYAIFYRDDGTLHGFKQMSDNEAKSYRHHPKTYRIREVTHRQAAAIALWANQYYETPYGDYDEPEEDLGRFFEMGWD